MTIGEKIKHLRKQQDVTQEKLAEYLSISYQAVSKWENGGAMPDITLVVPIANFFGVSTDTLFDMNAQVENEEITEIERVGKELANKGVMKERIEHWRRAVEKYPRNYSFLESYASDLYTASYSRDFENDDKESFVNEAVSIGLRIIEDCNDDQIRARAIQTLVFAYNHLKQHAKAVEYAKKATSIFLSRERLLEHAYTGVDAMKQVQNNTQSFMDMLAFAIRIRGYDSVEDKIFALQTSLKVFQLIYYDENYLFYHFRISDLYGELAAIYADKQDKDKMFEYLELAKKHSVLYDTLPIGKQNQTGIFLNMTEFDRSGTSKNYDCTTAELLKRELQENKSYDFIRDDDRFIKFMEFF